MNGNELFDAVTMIDDGFIGEAERFDFAPEARVHRRGFLKTLGAAAAFCALLTFLAYAVPRLIPAKEKDAEAASLPAPIIWSEALSGSEMRGGSPVRSYKTATESFEYWGDFALPDEIGENVKLKNEPTVIYSVSTSDPESDLKQEPVSYVGQYTYTLEEPGEELVVYVCSTGDNSFADHLSLVDQFPDIEELGYYGYGVNRGKEYVLYTLETLDEEQNLVCYAQLISRDSAGEGSGPTMAITVKSDGHINQTMFMLYFRRLVKSLYPDIDIMFI